MDPILLQVLNALTAAANAALGAVKMGADAGIQSVSTQVPKLSDEGLDLLENVVAPKLDVPAPIIAYFKSENAQIEAPVDAFAEAELSLLKARVDSLIPSSV